ncbi:resistin-like beta isoform X2 [Peromyscus eremicus]|uniref:resistin-like beta isoform X2 n=1 Tax=Peromyscus eremicus TaxID=42410 RepID=UPI0027DBD7C4|nr:resistin-like beta isoform X2 [Peromyscus eremicus]
MCWNRKCGISLNSLAQERLSEQDTDSTALVTSGPPCQLGVSMAAEDVFSFLLEQKYCGIWLRKEDGRCWRLNYFHREDALGGEPSTSMKPTICFLLIFVSLLHLMITVNTQSSVDSSVNKNNQDDFHGVDPHWGPSKLFCTRVKNPGRWSSCPPGMAVTGCACSSGCESWEIQNGNTCHCQCSAMDWTTTHCCRPA